MVRTRTATIAPLSPAATSGPPAPDRTFVQELAVRERSDTRRSSAVHYSDDMKPLHGYARYDRVRLEPNVASPLQEATPMLTEFLDYCAAFAMCVIATFV
jgi:hypothetical protein